ncbi:myeloperoxidase-like [Dromiciops gliroides]|uniref:myeloperoxidase-like n=1 Tax=Dromiciops gliroides TaxID=33562 RepID=UPI001CC66A38|nr:myeloperoxidase-like [Dromiciops gliroides]
MNTYLKAELLKTFVPAQKSRGRQDYKRRLTVSYCLSGMQKKKKTAAMEVLWILLMLNLLQPLAKASSDTTDDLFTYEDLMSCVEEAKEMVDAAYESSQKRAHNALESGKATPFNFMKYLKEPRGGTKAATQVADYTELTLQILKEKAWPTLGDVNITDILSPLQKEQIARATGCVSYTHTTECPEMSPYRTISGKCNNRMYPNRGASNQGFARWLPAEYEDGISLPKGATAGKLFNGFPLPLVRQVSNELAHVSNDNITHDQNLSVIFMQWGQWVDHDLDFSPSSHTNPKKQVPCGSTNCDFDSPCFPIKFPPNDPRITTRGICMPFTRTSSACNPDSFVREQINGITSFLDANMVYGSEDGLANLLRNKSSDMGLLAVNEEFQDEGLAFLPFETSTPNPCWLTNKEANISCFRAGDSRANENLGIMVFHTIFLREHNRLVSELKELNPHWDGEVLYQEARKIIGAVIQIINFRDYLPLVLGNEKEQYIPPYTGYNESVDPSVANIFSLAFRFGHSTIPSFMSRLNEKFQPNGPNSIIPLHLTFFATWRIILEGGIDPVLRGLLINPSKLLKQNAILNEEVQERLFKQTEVMGLDLAAINMQRGRDHGIPGYNAWRRFCGLSEPQTVEELGDVLQNIELAEKLLALYGTADNIDLWIGGLTEPFVPDGRVGPLLSCLIGRQFQQTRDGDRFWWENPGVFTEEQVESLKNVSLSLLFCHNTHLSEVPMDVFKVNNYPEDFINCAEFGKLDLSPWKVPIE